VKVALIPPKGYEVTALRSYYHLVLPETLTDSGGYTDYVTTYQRASARGDTVILDNGCYEGKLASGDELMDYAALIGATEIVAPDVMNDSVATHRATKQFIEDHPKSRWYKIMAVVQGSDWQDLVHEYSKMIHVTTLGIPKAQIKVLGDPTRSEIARWIYIKYADRFKIHLLGMHRLNLNELESSPPFVRSVDSALPYKFAEIGMMLSETSTPPKRRRDYFTNYVPVSDELLGWNIEQFEALGKGDSLLSKGAKI
jgi:hypothetical protein